MRNILACEDGNIAICSVYIFLYTANPIEWGRVSPSVQLQEREKKILTYPILLFTPPFFLFEALMAFGHPLPPGAFQSDVLITTAV